MICIDFEITLTAVICYFPESVWVMTRERFPTGPTLQKAYGVLDKFRITRSFFIKTDQSDCEILPPPVEAYDPTSPKPESSGTVS